MKKNTAEVSLDTLLEDAKRAQSLMESLDLNLIVEHDESEIRQLNQVISELEQIESAQAQPASESPSTPGQSSDTPKQQTPPEDAQPRTMEETDILTVVQNAGFGSRVGRVYFSGLDYPIKPLDYIPHRNGLPNFDVCLAPESAPAEAVQAIFVSERGVFCASITEPVADNSWRIIRSMPYRSNDEMLDLIQRFIDRSASEAL
ncbi:MAG: DUF1552 domain-containing protein [Pseudomonadales bacterium]|nr:DUF1552 domain-containing protein [Pseudomonadales bacterium]